MLSSLFSYFIACTGLLALYTLGRCIYNLFFHPLAKFPGPKFAAISNIWYSLHWLGGRWPYDIDELHKKYGDVVRIAPNDLSFATLQSWQDIYGHAVNGHKYFLKGEWYQRSGSGNGIVSERDPVKHREVRKSLAHAFSAKALRDQTAVALKYINMFVDQIGKLGTQDEGISMEEWYNWLTFDIIGDLAFGESFGAVEKARSHFWVELILNSTFLGSFQDVLKRLPMLKVLAPLVIPRSMAAQHKRHWELTQEMVAGRMTKENDRIDFFSHLLSEKATDLSRGFLMGQANTLIVAGSETTATALAGITHYLLNDLDKLRTLTKEVREAFSESGLINSDSTQHLQYLFAVIEEGLRLFPPAPFGLQRISPGAVIDDNYIPEGITVSTAIYTTSRRERYFYDAKSFHPERWLPANHPLYDSAFANDKKEASKPFSMGPRVCLGINLAYMEMRLALCKLVWHFDLELINKDINWERDTRLYLLWKKPKLMVKFTPVVR